MPLDDAACYAALRARDSRFDGRFFCGVSSTGIYCRPICRVRLPREENCSFFPSAAAAEAAGFRPCLKCRPELAPGLAPADASARVALSAARIIEEECLADHNLADLSDRLGISDRHLRRVFDKEYGVSPVQYLQTRRLLLAKNLLTDTRLPVTEVAMACGFGSIRRFNDLFLKRYRLPPARFRKEAHGAPADKDGLTLTLDYRPPYAWEELLSFLAARAVPGVESVAGNSYRRTVAMRKGGTLLRGWISVTQAPKRDGVEATVSSSLFPVLPRVLSRIRHLFDLDCDPVAVQEQLATMARVSPALPVAGIRIPGCFDPFEMATRAVLGQQVTVKAARTLATRLAAKFGEPVGTPFDELCCTFPLPETICTLEPVADHLGPLGIIGARARSIAALAQALVDGAITLAPHADAGQEMEALIKLPGFGPWTVKYVAMRALGWPDAFLDTDYGVKKALSPLPEEEARLLPGGWSPWRSYATVSLWSSLSATTK